MKLKLLAATAACLLAMPVGAATIVKNYQAVATFDSGPYDRIVLDFGLSYDPTETNYSERELTHFTSSVADPAFAGPVRFFNDRDGIVIGNPLNGADGFDWGTNDFFLAFFVDPQNGGALLDYTNTGLAQDYYTFDVTVREVASPAVPEPASWAMMVVGMALVGTALRSRRRTVSVSFG